MTLSALFLTLYVSLDGSNDWKDRRFSCSELTATWAREGGGVGFLIKNDKYVTKFKTIDDLMSQVRSQCGEKTKI